MSQNSLARSTLVGLIWEYSSVLAQVVLQLLVLGILSRLLSPEDFGLIGIALIFVGFAALFSQLGVGPAIVQRSSLTLEHIRVGFTLSVSLSLVMLLILWFSAPLLAHFFQTNDLIHVLRGVSLSFPLTGLGVVSEALLRRNLQFRKVMQVNVLAYVFGYACIGILLAWFGWGVWALVGALLGQSLVKSVLLFMVHPHPKRPLLTRRESEDLLYFGGGFTLARVFNYGANEGDNFVIGRVLDPAALGVYTRAYRLMMMPATYLGQALARVLFPVMARIQDDAQRLTRTYLTGMAVTSLVAAPASVLMVAMAGEIVEVILGSQWSDTIIPFQILAFGVLPRMSYKMDDSLARALGVMYRRSIRDAIYAVAVVFGTWIGLNWGLAGAALGVLCAIVLNYALAIRMSLGLLDCSWSSLVKAQAPGLLLAVIAVLVSVPARSLLHTVGVQSIFVLVIIIALNVVILAGLIRLYPKFLGVYGTIALSLIWRSLLAPFAARVFRRV
jgi:PST family polysaccharide transporter